MIAQPVHNSRIVVVEDDEALQRHVAVALRRSFTDLEVQGTKDPEEALHLLEDERSRLLITDAQTRKLDGIAVATSARKRRPGLPVIVMSNPPCNAQRLKNLGSAAWLEKPPKLERLVGLVERMLAVPMGFTGEITIDGLPDLVQLLSMAHSTGGLHIEHGDQRGCIWFEEGAIVDAVLDDEHGAQSFHKLVRWEGGVFALDRKDRARTHTIELPPMQLLLESMCLMDQDRAGVVTTGGSAPGEPANNNSNHRQDQQLKSPFNGHNQQRANSPSYIRLKGLESNGHTPKFSTTERASTPQQQAAESFQRGLDFAQSKQYGEALREWEAATRLDPDNRVYQVNLRRLREVQHRSQPPRGTDGHEE
jgi:CheY-like chemotaxis protein